VSSYRPSIVGPIGTHQKRSFEPYHPDPLRPPLPQDWDSQPQPKTAIAIISGLERTSNLADIHGVHDPNKSPLKILVKREHGRIQGLPKFFEHLLLSQEWVKIRTSNFVCTFIGSIGTKAH